MRFIFFGTPRFAEIVLKRLIETGFIPAAVITNPDRPVGRKKILTPPLVKKLALANKIKVFQPEKLKIENWPLKIGDIDIAVVAAYAKIIPKSILEIPKAGALGVHPSLLPKYRGATPIQSALLAGEKTTGTTIYKMDEQLDHGEIIATNEIPIAEEETYLTLEEKLALAGAELVIKNLQELVLGKSTFEEQNHSEATYTKKFKTEDAQVDMKTSPIEIYRKIQALNPAPGVWTMNFQGLEGKRVKLLEAQYQNNEIRVTKIQIEGKKPQNTTY